jgi:hypothetical protein
MADSDWYQKKFGHLAPQVPLQQPDTTPARFAPMPGQWNAPAMPQVQRPAVPQTVYPSEPQSGLSPDQREWEDLDAGEERRIYLLTHPKKMKGNADAQNCPECGGELFFSRRNGGPGLANRNTYPAPQCANCGWPLVQSGSIGGALEQGEN